MSDFFTRLPTTLQHFEEIKAELEKKLKRLRSLHKVVEHQIPQLETWNIPTDLMRYDKTAK
jgi:hypothetical protein